VSGELSKQSTEALKRVGALAAFIVIIIGGLLLSSLYEQGVHKVLSSTPSCKTDAPGIASLINQYRTAHGAPALTQMTDLNTMAKYLSDQDSTDSSMTLTSDRITQAIATDPAASQAATYQIFPSSDNVTDSSIFHELSSTPSYTAQMLDTSVHKIGVYVNCADTAHDVTIHTDSSQQANINGKKYHERSLTYIVYDN
jgi:hypothetical protein